MSDVPTLYERNAAFAETFDKGDLPIKPNLSTLILTCVDARVDPAYFVGLELGDALTLRTVGARVTDAVAYEAGALWMLMSLAGTTPSLELTIIGHTQCGMARFADPEVAAKVTEHFGTDEVVNTYAIADSAQAIREDVERLRANPAVPREMEVSGHVYDVATGALTQIVETTTVG